MGHFLSRDRQLDPPWSEPLALVTPFQRLTDWSVITYRTTTRAVTTRGNGYGPSPPPEAPFAKKMAFYRSQHTSKGVRVTHLLTGGIDVCEQYGEMLARRSQRNTGLR